MIQNIFDPRVAAYVCDTDLSESNLEFNFLCGKFSININTIELADMGRVATAVAHCHAELKGLIQLKLKFEVELIKREGRDVFRRMEMPLVALLAQMEIRGDNSLYIYVIFMYKCE